MEHFSQKNFFKKYLSMRDVYCDQLSLLVTPKRLVSQSFNPEFISKSELSKTYSSGSHNKMAEQLVNKPTQLSQKNAKTIIPNFKKFKKNVKISKTNCRHGIQG